MFKGGAVTPAPWDPLRLHPYAGWDALLRSDLITVGGGDAVSSWKDIVAGYDLVQATGDAQPVFDGLFVRSDGVDDELTLAPVPSGIPTGATACEWWLAVDQQTPASDAVAKIVAGIGDAADTSTRMIRRQAGSGVNRAGLRDTSGTTQTVNAVDFSYKHVLRAVATGTQTWLEADGASTAIRDQVSAIATVRVRMFASPILASANAFWQGGISALWITPLLTTSQAAQMYAYLNARL